MENGCNELMYFGHREYFGYSIKLAQGYIYLCDVHTVCWICRREMKLAQHLFYGYK